MKESRRGKNRKKKYRRKQRTRYLVLFVVIFVLALKILPGAARIIRRPKANNIPLYLQSDKPWGDEIYGSGKMRKTGCGPTCLSMVYVGLTGDKSMNPYEVAKKAEKKGYYVWGQGSSWDMMDSMAKKMGLRVVKVGFNAADIKNALSEGTPIICSVGPGDFTRKGHFIVLAGVTKNGKIIVHDPNSLKQSKKKWDLDRILPQVKNLWGYQY